MGLSQNREGPGQVSPSLSTPRRCHRAALPHGRLLLQESLWEGLHILMLLPGAALAKPPQSTQHLET